MNILLWFSSFCPAHRRGRVVEVFQFRANRAFVESDSSCSLDGDERLGAALLSGPDPPGTL